jgi:hypothetical protein
MTLANAAAARVRLIVWCKSCQHRLEPDPAEMARRYGAEMPVLKRRERLVCSRCGGRQVDMVVKRRIIADYGQFHWSESGGFENFCY